RFANHRWLLFLACALVLIGCGHSRAPVGSSTVEKTNNPLVALYSIQPPADATVSIQFGPTRSYGLSTWEQPTPKDGSPVKIYVAGMRANTTYHMRAVVKFTNGQMST